MDHALKRAASIGHGLRAEGILNEAAPERQSEDPGISDVEFRTLTHKHKRRAFKLERLFWRILEGAASANKTPLAEFVAGIVSKHEDSSNRTSLLRVSAAQWLMSRLLELSEKSLGTKTLGSITRASPTATFIVNTSNAIEWPNESFLRLLEQVRSTRGAPEAGPISIRFRSDVSSLIGRCRSSSAGFVTDEIVLTIGGQMQVLEARIAAIESTTARPMGFVVYIADAPIQAAR